MVQLSVEEAESLTDLKVLLDEAVVRTRNSAEHAARTSVILLDGAAEATISLCLSRFNDGPSDNDTLASSYGKLVQSLRGEGVLNDDEQITQWPNVNRLRRARNLAQHHQIPTDRRTLGRWASQVQRFVQDAVIRTYGVDIALVTTAEAIRDPELRRTFGDAERALGKDDFFEAIRFAEAAFDAAVERWRKQQAGVFRSTASRFRDSLGINDAITNATRDLQNMVTVTPFAIDMGEFVWWKSVIDSLRFKDSSDEVSREDAERGMSFVFLWIVRWESFAEGFDETRTVRELPCPPFSSRLGGEPELLVDKPVEVVIEPTRNLGGQTEESNVVALAFAAGIDTESAWKWAQLLGDAFLDLEGVPWQRASVSTNGTIHLYFSTEDAQVNVDALMKLVGNAFHEAIKLDGIKAAEEQARAQQWEVGAGRLVNAALATRTHSGGPAFAGYTVSESGNVPTVTFSLVPDLYATAAYLYDRKVREVGSDGLTHLDRGYIGINIVSIPGDCSPEEGARLAEQAVETLESAAEQMAKDKCEKEDRANRLREQVQAQLSRFTADNYMERETTNPAVHED